MLIGTSCRFSTRFCAVTVTVSSVAALRSPSAGGVAGASWARAVAPNAR